MDMVVFEISKKAKFGEFATATNDLIQSIIDINEKVNANKLPDLSSVTQTLASVLTYLGYFSKYATQLGIAGAGFRREI